MDEEIIGKTKEAFPFFLRFYKENITYFYHDYSDYIFFLKPHCFERKQID